MDLTLAPVLIFTAWLSSIFSIALTTSIALSLSGNTLFPLSVFNFKPKDSNRSIRSSLVKEYKELYMKLPFLYMLFIIVSRSDALVTLHLPLPVILIFLPNILFFSIIVTWAPSLAAK